VVDFTTWTIHHCVPASAPRTRGLSAVLLQLHAGARALPLRRAGFRHYAKCSTTDAAVFGGSDMGNVAGATSEPVMAHNREHSILVTLPPLGVVVFKKR